MNKSSLNLLNTIGNGSYENQRQLAEASGYSLGKVNMSVRELTEAGYINRSLKLTEEGRAFMAENRPERAVILAAEGEKQSAITRAEGEKESAILRADAIREERIRTAQGEAEAIAAVAEAQARAIEMINRVQPSKEYLQIRSMEAAEKMADGQATKIVVPSNLQDVAGLATLFKETVR